MPIIRCPHCGATRNPAAEKIPSKPAKAKCPECATSLRFIPAEQTCSAAPAGQVSCPNCGFPRSIPPHRPTTAHSKVSCRRCQHSFRLSQVLPATATQRQQQTERKLKSIGQLLAGSWELFCRRGWGLLAVYLISCCLLFTPLLAAAFFLPSLVAHNDLLLWGSLLGAILFGAVGGAWTTASIFSHICNPQLRIWHTFVRGKRQLWRFAGLLFLLGLIIGGGSLLFIVPGILFTVWFSFCYYILAEEGSSGIASIEKSYRLVRGRGWAVFRRLLLLLVVSMTLFTLSARLPVIGTPLNILLSLLLTPFALL